MIKIENINIKNSVSRQNIKNVLGYAVKERHGYYNKIKTVDERRGDTIDKFKTAGFLNTGHAFKSETYSITELGDEYYKNMFGCVDFWKQRLSGVVERFIKRHV